MVAGQQRAVCRAHSGRPQPIIGGLPSPQMRFNQTLQEKKNSRRAVKQENKWLLI
jgi:hypothetical protein